MIQLIEYNLTLSTNEFVSISELDPERIPELLLPEVKLHLSPLLERCTHINRKNLEDAKAGYDKELLKVLRDPLGALTRCSNPLCRLIDDCHMADRKVCTLRNLSKKKPVPQCWEFNVKELENKDKILDIGSAIGHAWLSNSYVVYVINS